MNLADDPFMAVAHDNDGAHVFEDLTRRPTLLGGAEASAPTPPRTGFAIAKLHGFDLSEQPLITHVVDGIARVTHARATVKLRRRMVGTQVVVAYENSDAAKPIIMGVVEADPLSGDDSVGAATTHPHPMHAVVDGGRHVIEAEREIVLRCGDASITLTRAGKVLIKGTYILSRATGYNKIKGAAIDIN